MSNSFAHQPSQPVPVELKDFPAWRYGPNGESGIFDKPQDVPAGWVDNPNKFKESAEQPQVEEAPQTQPDPEPVASEPQPEPEPVTTEDPETQEPVAPQVENSDQPAAPETPEPLQADEPVEFHAENISQEEENKQEGVPAGDNASSESQPVEPTGDAPEAEDEQPLSLEEIKGDLAEKSMNDLYKIAGELGLDKSGKKPELIDRIAQKLHEESVASEEPKE